MFAIPVRRHEPATTELPAPWDEPAELPEHPQPTRARLLLLAAAVGAMPGEVNAAQLNALEEHAGSLLFGSVNYPETPEGRAQYARLVDTLDALAWLPEAHLNGHLGGPRTFETLYVRAGDETTVVYSPYQFTPVSARSALGTGGSAIERLADATVAGRWHGRAPELTQPIVDLDDVTFPAVTGGAVEAIVYPIGATIVADEDGAHVAPATEAEPDNVERIERDMGAMFAGPGPEAA